MGRLILTIAFLFVMSGAAPAADNCELVPVWGRVVYSVGVNQYRPVRNARVLLMRGPQSWVGITAANGSYRLMVPMCSTYQITAAQSRYHFNFQTFRLPVDDQIGINIDLVGIQWPPKRKK